MGMGMSINVEGKLWAYAIDSGNRAAIESEERRANSHIQKVEDIPIQSEFKTYKEWVRILLDTRNGQYGWQLWMKPRGRGSHCSEITWGYDSAESAKLAAPGVPNLGGD